MSHNSEEGNTTAGSQALEGEIPILLPIRYDPETGGSIVDSPTRDVTPSSTCTPQQSRFSLGRKARDMVDSLLPEPLRARNVTQKKTVKIGELPENLAASSSAVIYNHDTCWPRPPSSVYDDDCWPDLTPSDESVWPFEETSGNFRFIHKGNKGKQPARSDNLREPQAGATGTKANLEHLQSPSGYGNIGLRPSCSEKALPSLPHSGKSELPKANVGGSPGTKTESGPLQGTLHQFPFLADQKDVYSQLAALRAPIRRRHEACLPASTHNDDDSLPQEQTATASKGHVSFDPIDPYHRSGLPKKKVLYGPDGYLGKDKDKDWKQSSLQKMTEKVESFGNRVKRGIQRSKDLDRDDNRMELLHGIVMKPNLSINVDAEVQAEIYSKLELFMCTTANSYLLTQMQHGRFVGNESVKRFVNFWKSKNRPLVPEFQFDLRIQRDIILHNIRFFDFPGNYGLNPVLLKSTLDGWGSVINQLDVRTYCWPDSALRKIFHDVQPVLEMLGASREVLKTFLNIRNLVIGLIHHAKLRKRVEDLQRMSNGQELL